jgi:DNA-binding response OmpR family regulator
VEERPTARKRCCASPRAGPTSSCWTGCCRLSGIEVCRQLRRRPATRDLPVIMVTARTEDGRRPRARHRGRRLRHQALRVEALMARIRALLRRAAPSVPSAGSHRLRMTSRWTRTPTAFTRAGARCISARTEYRLLEYFLSHPAASSRREQLLDAVWGRDIHVELRTWTCTSAAPQAINGRRGGGPDPHRPLRRLRPRPGLRVCNGTG